MSASGAHRWVHCQASIPLAKALGAVGRTSAAADEGTMAHDLSEQLLRGEIEYSDVPAAFRPHIKKYVDECQAIAASGDISWIEAEVPLYYSKSEMAYLDFAVLDTTNKTLWIRDLKYGQGKVVDAEYNEQLTIYAYSLVCHLMGDYREFFEDELFKVNVGIVQPRGRSGNPIKVWEVSLPELKEEADKIEEAYKSIKAADGDWNKLPFNCAKNVCMFCPIKQSHKVICPEMERQAMEGFQDLTLHDVESMSDGVKLKKDIPKKIEQDLIGWSDEKLLAWYMAADNIQASA